MNPAAPAEHLPAPGVPRLRPYNQAPHEGNHTLAKAKNGDTVTVHYTGRLADGTVFDSSRERDPLEFELGEGRVIPGFENAVRGLEPGASVTAEIPPADAYGEARDELVMTISAEQLPEDMDPQIGDQLEMRTQEGQAIPVRVVALEDDTITLDANHPLAGQELTFDIELVEID